MGMGIEIASALAELYPDKFEIAKMMELVGNVETIGQLSSEKVPQAIVTSWGDGLKSFHEMRAKYLLYP